MIHDLIIIMTLCIKIKIGTFFEFANNNTNYDQCTHVSRGLHHPITIKEIDMILIDTRK